MIWNSRQSARWLQELGWKRSDIVISTKIFWGGSGVNDKGLSRKHLIEGLQVLVKTTWIPASFLGHNVSSEKMILGIGAVSKCASDASNNLPHQIELQLVVQYLVHIPCFWRCRRVPLLGTQYDAH